MAAIIAMSHAEFDEMATAAKLPPRREQESEGCSAEPLSASLGAVRDVEAVVRAAAASSGVSDGGDHDRGDGGEGAVLELLLKRAARRYPLAGLYKPN